MEGIFLQLAFPHNAGVWVKSEERKESLFYTSASFLVEAICVLGKVGKSLIIHHEKRRGNHYCNSLWFEGSFELT